LPLLLGKLGTYQRVDTATLEFSDHLEDQQIKRYLDKLPTAQREVVRGVYFQDMSQEQLAQQLNIPVGTVKSRLRLALQKLRNEMGDQHD
jgi:RNA polymerase sigma-70 factor (ECF subfamily)